jgi:fibro-slime domain-containing protein
MHLHRVGRSSAVLRSSVVLFALVLIGCGGSTSTRSDAGARDPDAGEAGVEPDPVCGNGMIERDEVCDDGNTDDGDTCSANCDRIHTAPDCTVTDTCPEVCGNALFDPDESCDDGNESDGDGCDSSCKVESGWGCARPGSACVRLPVCGNSLRERGEECDSGPSSDPGCTECKVQSGFWCGKPGEPCVVEQCGNGKRTPDEACDDGNTQDDDGCSKRCAIEDGWRCSTQGCRPICGDDVLHGNETCEDGNTTSGDGCSAGCRIEPGAACPTLGAACGEAVCGNSQPEGGEGCDDGNLIGGDGCGPTCQLEPEVTVGANPVVHTRCGDGLVTSGEACDDGNASSGDGCSASCAVETGFSCTQQMERPASVRMKVTYRDFKARNEAGGHPHMRQKGETPPDDGLDLGIVGAVCTTSNGSTCGRLDADGKPVLAAGTHKTVNTAGANYPAAFALWYRNTNTDNITGANGVIATNANPPGAPADGDFLTLTREGTTASYSFDSAVFYPLNARAFGNTADETNNYHFTTELRSFFQYRGGETLTFRGDDDVWVFINGRLAVDIGGIHGPEWGRVVLGDTDSSCTVGGGASTPTDCTQSPAELADNTDTRFGLTKGNVYEIVLFNAERHPTGSNFRLTLAGFLAPRSYCEPICGDGIVAGWETCDSGAANEDGKYGVCNSSCSAMDYCGDNIKQSDHEDCDNGFNQDLLYTSGDTTACAPGCVLPPMCGDGVVQSPYELCDDGPMNDDTKYRGCTTRCDWGPYCGDGTVDPGETCDEGAGNVSADEAGLCGYDCRPAYILE